MVTTTWARQRCLERLDAMGGSSADLIEIRLTALAELRRVIGFDRWCAMLTDPDTLVPWRALSEVDWWQDTPRLNQISATEGDPQSVLNLARSRIVADSLARVTGGDKLRSPVFRDVLAGYGCGDELRATATDRSGTWGTLHLFRSSDDADFTEDELALVRDVAPLLAGALRRGVSLRAASASAPEETGVLLVDDALGVLSRTASADAWLDRLNPERIAFPDGVPGVVWAVVGALQGAEADGAAGRAGAAGGAARVRVQTADGAWGVIEAARMGSTGAADSAGTGGRAGGRAGGGPIAVTVRAARQPELVDLFTRAHGLTAREAEIVTLLTAGATPASIAAELVISPHTVEDHIRSAMAKSGARNRRALAQVFG